MPRLTLSDAEDKARKGRPWSFRLEYCGHNATNQSGHSDKYWFATGRGINEPVEIGWGRWGSNPQTMLADWAKLRDKTDEKLNKGYDYADHGYVRMSAKSIAKLGGATTSAPATGGGGKAKTKPTRGKAKPAPVSQHPLGNPVQAKPAPVQVTKPAGPVSPDLLALGEPWSLVRSLRVIRNGTTLTGYSAVDENGDELLKFDPQGGVEFARDYDVDIEWA